MTTTKLKLPSEVRLPHLMLRRPCILYKANDAPPAELLEYLPLYAYQATASNEIDKFFCVFDLLFEVTTAVNYAHGVPVSLDSIGHEALEVWILDTMSSNNCIQIPPKHQLGRHVFRLRIAIV